MRTTISLLAIAVCAMLAAGCGSGGAKASPVVGVLWAWTGLEETQPAHLSSVPDPRNYLLILNKDGSFQAKADCNQLHGTYTLSGDNLTLTPGPMTLAECAPDSLSNHYIQLLTQVATQSTEDGQLTLGLKEGGGSMFFHGAS